MTDTAHQVPARRVRFDPTRPRGADDYKRAHRHSRRVRFLKYALPTIAVVSVAGFFLTMRFADITGAALVGLAGLNIEKKSLVMDAPHMSGYDASHHPYQLKAIKALQDLANPKVVTLDTIDAHFATDDDSTASLQARSGVFDGYKNTLALRDGITIETSDGYRAILQDANIDITKGNIVSQKPVEIHSSDGWLKANGVQIVNRGARVTFVNGVSVNFVPPADDQDAAKADTDKAGGKPDTDKGAAQPDADKIAAKPGVAGKAAATPDAARKPGLASAKEAAAARLKSITE
jgi:lipopolysaccharide export system protein LptC